jgi:LPS-assembly protein
VNKRFFLVCSLLVWLAPPHLAASTPPQSDIKKRFWEKNKHYRANWPKQLGWVEDPDTPTICRGYYIPKEQSDFVTPPNFADAPIAYITADQGELNPTGRSNLIGNVLIKQPTRSTRADRAEIYRDANGNIIKINLYGEVKAEEEGKIFITPQAQFNLMDDTSTLGPSLYRFRLEGFPATTGHSRITDELYGWGHADQVIRLDKDHYELLNATYTTCPPGRMPWQIRAHKLYIDQETDEGLAKHATFNIGKVPILYTPWYKFPLAGQRKTGFLVPLAGYSQDLGAILGLPFYLNIAPNVDATITPTYYSERVFAIDNKFRYLFGFGQGSVNFNLLPNDREFAKFKQENQLIDPTIVNESNTRYSLQFEHLSQFTEHWSASLDFNKVSDDFFLQDLSTNLAITTENQLLRQARADYKDEHWDFYTMVQSFQTLSPFNQQIANPVYRHLPKVGAKASYPEVLPHVNFGFAGEFDYFEWPEPSRPEPQGVRMTLYPELSMPMISSAGFVTPKIMLHQAYYDLQQPIPDTKRSINVNLPVFSVDSGLYIDRQQRLFGRNYQQTITPRLYYLYVPTNTQSQVANFDSTYNIFNFDQLFRYNRFSGNDRLMNANQVSLGVSSSWYDQDKGIERFSIGVGQTYYFENRKVFICNEVNNLNCNDKTAIADSSITGFTSPNASASPIAGFANVNFSPHLGLTSNAAWDPHTASMNNANVSLVFRPGPEKLLSIGYSFLTNADITLEATDKPDNNLHYINTSIALPLSDKWSSIGIFQYSLSKKVSMEYYGGLEYNACCWGVRFLAGRIFRNLNNDFTPNFRDAIFVQIVFRGLSSVSSSDRVQGLIADNLPGYVDLF